MANIVLVDSSDEAFILVGFADEQNGEYRNAIHFQRSHKFDDQDVALGMDSVYVERNGQSQGGYDRVERVELHPDQLRIVVGGEVAESMGDTEFEIGLSLPPGEFEQMRQGLRSVFAGFDSLTELPASS